MASLGAPTIAKEAVLSAQSARFTGWISRFHYFAGAIALFQVQELVSYSVPTFFKRTKDQITQAGGQTYCSSQNLRLCDPQDFDSLCNRTLRMQTLHAALKVPKAD
ncbi:hypothetical protein PRNP1_014066 [Phytophthora ramorum]